MTASAFDREQPTLAQINITPLVDVMLVLLVIFMIAAPVLSHPITLDSPGLGPDQSQLKPPPPIELRIDAAGGLYWNGDPLPLAALRQALAAEIARDPGNAPTLRIDASGDADYGVVAKVLAAAKNAEANRIAFVAR